MIYPTEQLAPFVRNGRPRPLTTEDYATISGARLKSASVLLWRLVDSGFLTSTQDPDARKNIYDITDEGLECLTGVVPVKPAIPAKLADARVAAVAKRAFGGAIDVRSLLPEYEEAIGDMMRREVPRQFRPVPPTNRGDIAAFRRAHAERVRAGAVA